MTDEEKKEYLENQKKIELLLKRQMELNPYSILKQLSNKEFGENWSESQVRIKCPSFQKDNRKGHDLLHPLLGRIEVKSTRLPLKQITYNQCHPYECEYFLFVNYNTIEGTEEVYLVKSQDILDSNKFSISKQHSRESGDCYSMSGTNKKNKESLKKYYIGDLVALNLYLGGINVQN